MHSALNWAVRILSALALALTATTAIATDISWNNPAGGSWETAANWDPTMVPGGSDNAVLSLAGPYTVVETGNRSVNSISITLATPELWIQGSNAGGHTTLTSANGFTNAGTLRLESINAGYACNLTLTTGTLANNGLIQVNPGTGGGRTITANVANAGAINVAAGTTLSIDAAGKTFDQNAGSIIASGSGTFLMDGGTFNFNGGTTSGSVYVRNGQLSVAPTVTGTSTILITGNTPTLLNNASATTTVWVQGNNLGNHTTLGLPDGSANAGTIRMESIDSGYNCNLSITGSFTNNASGVIQANPGTGGTRTISGNLINAGTLNVAPGALLVFPNSYTAAGGTINGLGYLLNATLSVTASPAQPTTILTTGPTMTLASGNLANTTIWVQGSALGNHTTLTSASGFSNNGTLRLESINAGYACNLTLTTGTLANNGLIQVNPGTGGGRTITANVANAGAINVAAGTTLSIAAAGKTFDQNAGSIIASGSGTFLMDGGTFNFNGGTTSGSVYVRNGQLNVAPTVTGTSTILITGNTPTLINNGSPTTTVWAQGSNVGSHTTLTLADGGSNVGTIRMEAIDQGFNTNLNIPGTTFTNAATGLIQVNTGSGGSRVINGNLTNAGTINVAPGALLRIPDIYTAAGGAINGAGYLHNATLREMVSPAATTPLVMTGPSCTLATDNTAGTTLWVQGSNVGSHTTLTSANGFTNAGTLRLESIDQGFNLNVIITSGSLNNSGTLQANPGSGGTRTITGNVTNSGAINVAAGTTLSIDAAGKTFNQNAGSITGAGTFVVDGGLFNFNGGTTSGSVYVRNGQLNVAPTVTGTSTILITGNTPTLINNGSPTTTVWAQGSNVGSHTTLTLADGGSNVGTIRMESIDQGFNIDLIIPNGAMNNAGTLQVNPGSGGSRTITGNVTNTGNINVAAGTTLNIAGNITNDVAGTLTGGAFDVGGVLRFNNALINTNAAAIALNGPSSAILNQSSNNALASLAAITASGSLSLRAGRTMSTSAASFVNDGLLLLEFNTSFHAAGGFNQTSSANYAVEIGGTSPGTTFSRVTAAGAVTLDGALRVRLANGFAPVINDAFQIIVGASRTGQFANLDSLEACGSRVFQIVYGPTDAKLVTIASTFPTGDVNHDGLVNATDLSIFRNVILGLDADYLHQVRSDLNCDGLANGADIQPFAQALLP